MRRAGPQGDDEGAAAEGRRAVRRPADRALDERREDAAALDHRAGRVHVHVDPDAAAPDGQDTPDEAEEALLPRPVEAGRAAAERPDPRLGGERLEGQERVQPAPVDRREEEVATCRRDVLAAPRVDAEPADAEQEGPPEPAREAVGEPGANLRRLPEPVEPLADVASRPAQLLGPNVRRGSPRPRARSSRRRGCEDVARRDSVAVSAAPARRVPFRPLPGGRAGAMPPGQDRQRAQHEGGADDRRDRDVEEDPVVGAERLEEEARRAVPDEEEQDDVARAQSA